MGRMYLLKKQYLVIQMSCSRIQANFRGFVTRKKYTYQKVCTITIQRWVSARFSYKRFRMLVFSVTKLQSKSRMFITRKCFQGKRNACIQLQTFSRTVLAQKSFNSNLMKVVQLQSMIRGYFARKELSQKHIAAGVIQSKFWRARCERGKFISTINRVIIIQANVRCFLQRENHKQINRATKTIQYHIKNWLIQIQRKRAACLIQNSLRQMWKRRQCVIKIQAIWRAFYYQSLFAQFCEMVVCIQRHSRGLLVRKRLEREQLCAVKIQSQYRSFFTRTIYESCRYDVLVMQSIVRRYIAKKQFRNTLTAIITIQRFAQKALAKSVEQRLQRRAMTKIQALVRGYFARRVSSKIIK